MWEKPAIVFGPLRTPEGKCGLFTPWQMEMHRRHAEHIAQITWRAGYATVCPHKNTEDFDGLSGLSAKAFIRGDGTFSRCFAGQGGVAILAKGWEDSEGSCQERQDALEVGLPIVPFSALAYDDARLFWYLRTLYTNPSSAGEFMEAMEDPRADPEAVAKRLGIVGAVV